ncbi:MAG TPA: 50S ribosomal protein L25 [Candidatus Moranbacteria bacterium]|nr:50S ribosomal protein L25 [Candidatus Moranbacteria bacterium]
MEKATLEAKARVERGRKVNKGRKEGMVPAVVYGNKIDSVSLWVKEIDMKRLVKKYGESVIVEMNLDDKEKRNVLIQDIQKGPVRGQYVHVDFFQVRMDEKIENEVELVFVGESKAVKELGGILVKNIDKLTVKCLPADLPSHIDVDISMINDFETHITVKDIKISRNIELGIDPETVIALVAPQRSEEELAQLEEKVEADVTKIEGVVKEEPASEGEDKNKK